MTIQVKAAAAAAVLVATKALAARPPEVRALPALKPNQPNQSRPAPITTMRDIVGFHGILGETAAPAQQEDQSQRRDSGVEVDHGTAGKIKNAEPGQPAAAAPDPVGYRTVNQSQPQSGKDERALNFILSTMAPVIRATVMMANMAWNIMKAR